MVTNKESDDPLSKLNDTLKRFLRDFGEPESFRIAEEAIKVHYTNAPFCAKYIKIKGLNSPQFGDLVKMVGGRDDINDESGYLTYVFSFINGEDKTTVVTPNAIYSVSANIKYVKDVVFNDQWNVFDSIELTFPHRFYLREVYFDSGYTAVFSDVPSEDETLNTIAKKEYNWKKRIIDVKTRADNRLIPEEFKDKGLVIKDRINALHKGDDKGKNIIYVPPEEFSIHLGKLLRFYFDKTLDKSQIKINDETVDISDLQLPGLKKKKINLKKKISKETQVYNDLAKIGIEKDMEPIRRIPYNTKSIKRSSLFLLELAIKEKDSSVNTSDIWIGDYSNYKILRIGKNVIISKPGSLLKINTDAIAGGDSAEKFVDELRSAVADSIEKLKYSVYDKFKLVSSQISCVCNNPRDGIIIATKDPIFWNTKEWKEYKITVPLSNRTKVNTSVRAKGRTIWADRKAVKKVINATTYEKIKQWKKYT